MYVNVDELWHVILRPRRQAGLASFTDIEQERCRHPPLGPS
jgi:hypothetical protein